MTHLVHINPLLFEPGDRLSLAEFLERWEQMPGLQFAELIDGVVHVPSPVSYSHGSVHGNVLFMRLRNWDGCMRLPDDCHLVDDGERSTA